MIVTHTHYRTIPARGRAGWCNNKGREWFARHRLDWGSFVKNGIPEETLLATGDGLAERLVAWAHECAAKESAGGR